MGKGVSYIRFFPDDWISGTQDLSLEERGALITVVALTASLGHPPLADYGRLALRLGCTPAKAKKLMASLERLGKIEIDGEYILNDRALLELKFSQNKSQKQSECVASRWKKIKKRTKFHQKIKNSALKTKIRAKQNMKKNSMKSMVVLIPW